MEINKLTVGLGLTALGGVALVAAFVGACGFGHLSEKVATALLTGGFIGAFVGFSGGLTLIYFHLSPSKFRKHQAAFAKALNLYKATDK